MQLKIDPIRARRSKGRGLAWPMIVACLSLTRLPAVGAEGARDRETNALLEIRSVIVDGATVSPRPAEKLRLSPHTRSVTFGFSPTMNAIRQPIRIRFKLDGYEEGWRESLVTREQAAADLGN